MDLKNAILYPWTQDFLISLISIITGLKLAIMKWDSVEPFYVSKKLSQALWGSTLKLAKLMIYNQLGY